MQDIAAIGLKLKEVLALEYFPVGMYYANEKPDASLSFNEKGKGCIMPLLFLSAKGKTVSVDENTTGWACSAYYLGYSDWIFDGIEYFLSDGLTSRECEKFVDSPEKAKQYVESMRIAINRSQYTIFKPLVDFKDGEKPEVVTFFLNADQLSALTYLVYFNAPLDDNRIITRFLSACGSMVTEPLKYQQMKEKKAVIGLNDISARKRLPKDLMTFSLTYSLFEEISENIDKSFLTTSQWGKMVERIIKD